MSMFLQEVVKHQWDPRVGILAPPKKGYVWWSYGEPCCSCDEYMGDSHAMYTDFRVIHAHDVHNHLIDDLCLAISLRVEGSVFSVLGVQQ
jgi:hypothetical protein